MSFQAYKSDIRPDVNLMGASFAVNLDELSQSSDEYNKSKVHSHSKAYIEEVNKLLVVLLFLNK